MKGVTYSPWLTIQQIRYRYRYCTQYPIQQINQIHLLFWIHIFDTFGPQRLGGKQLHLGHKHLTNVTIHRSSIGRPLHWYSSFLIWNGTFNYNISPTWLPHMFSCRGSSLSIPIFIMQALYVQHINIPLCASGGHRLDLRSQRKFQQIMKIWSLGFHKINKRKKSTGGPTLLIVGF